nr:MULTISPECIES: 2OG-Fe(II) oxygenase family protein [unclassified Streptomyces]
MRVLRFPAGSRTTERGIGAHTDYGLLVIAAQDEVGGLHAGLLPRAALRRPDPSAAAPPRRRFGHPLRGALHPDVHALLWFRSSRPPCGRGRRRRARS